MKSFAIASVVALLAAASSAAPSDRRQFAAQVTFIGAADAKFTQSIPADGSIHYIYNPLSISKISSLGGATCSFHGVDGSNTVVVGSQTVDVGPPQTQVWGSCRAF